MNSNASARLQERRAEDGHTSISAAPANEIASGRLPLALYFLVILAQMDMVVDFRHPRHWNPVVLSVGAVVSGELDAVTLDVINLSDFCAAGGINLHVFLDVGVRANGSSALVERCCGLIRVLSRHGVLQVHG